MDFHPYHGRSGWLKELERLIADLQRDKVPPGRISVLLLKTPRGDEEKHLERMGLRRLSEDDVPHLGSASLQYVTWSIVSGFKGLENDVVIVAGLTDIETDWHRGVAYVGMSRARTRLHVVIQDDCDGKRREREVEWEARGDIDVEMLLRPLQFPSVAMRASPTWVEDVEGELARQLLGFRSFPIRVARRCAVPFPSVVVGSVS